MVDEFLLQNIQSFNHVIMSSDQNCEEINLHLLHDFTSLFLPLKVSSVI